MDYYELEYTIENLLDDLKKKNKSEEEEQKKYDSGSMMKSAQNGYKGSINIPKMPGLSVPNFSGKMPKF